jgi:5-methylcytosine-specific restriction protein A
MTWSLEVGDRSTRAQLQRDYGGARYGGIEPAHDSDNLFVYSDPESGSEFGYDFDGWLSEDEVFLYTGDGQVGDQELSGRNLTLADHADRGLRVRLFVADGITEGTKATKSQRYAGEFRVDPEQPFTMEDGPDKNGDGRKLLVFRLVPVGEVGSVFEATSQGKHARHPLTSLVPIETINTLEFTQSRDEANIEAERREAALVTAFAEYLESVGHESARHRIAIPDSTHPLFTDIVDVTDGTLYEAKGSANRHNIRLAIGQLFDYRRWLDPEPQSISVLLPTEPAPDMRSLLEALGIGCVWQEPGGTFSPA